MAAVLPAVVRRRGVGRRRSQWRVADTAPRRLLRQSVRWTGEGGPGFPGTGGHSGSVRTSVTGTAVIEASVPGAAGRRGGGATRRQDGTAAVAAGWISKYVEIH